MEVGLGMPAKVGMPLNTGFFPLQKNKPDTQYRPSLHCVSGKLRVSAPRITHGFVASLASSGALVCFKNI